ncbi:hypothetical protein PMAYCL1PPCAC_29135 [Pristionchus mayeri]|uniref:Bbs-8 n=1 Tax=Pristionchus mayeri TaxID=1317129 RepID=A0AAN5DA87_9BILA|nr:hypothetical protein PMAYCL1PPCAC_29135 [Pristionchus mayeri]
MLKDAEHMFHLSLRTKKHPETFAYLAKVHARLDQPVQTIKDYEDGLASFPDDITLLIGLARTHERLNNLEESFKTYKRVAKIKANDIESIACIATHYFYTDKQEVAVKRAHHEMDKEVAADIWYNTGHIALSIADVKMATRCFRLALACDADHVESLTNLGVILMKQDKWEQARSLFSSAVIKGPLQFEPHFNLSLLCEKMGFYSEARVTIIKALEIFPAHVPSQKLFEKIDLSFKMSVCSVPPSVKCPWGIVTMSGNQCEKGFRFISCGITLKRGNDRDWIFDNSSRLSNLRKSRLDQKICWKRTEESLQVLCPDNKECESLTLSEIVKICEAENPEEVRSIGSTEGCANSSTRLTCNGVSASITREECQKGFHYLYCGWTAVKERGEWKYTGKSKHFLYGGISEPCRFVNETSMVTLCRGENCNDEEWRERRLKMCASKISPIESTTIKTPTIDNGPFKQDWFHSEEDLLQNMVEIDEKSVERVTSLPLNREEKEEEETRENNLNSRLSRQERKTDPVVELLNRDFARNDLTLQGIAQNLITLTEMVQNISESVNKLENVKVKSESSLVRPVFFGPNWKAFKNCSIIIASLVALGLIICIGRACRKKILSRTPLPDLTPIENGERTYTSLQMITETSRHSLLSPSDLTRRSTLMRDEIEGGQRKSFFLDDNNMQSMIAEARDMQLREDHESQM